MLVDDEAGSLVDLNGALADLTADLLDGRRRSPAGVLHTGDDLDELHAVSGVEEVHADQTDGFRPLPISVMDREEVLEAKTALGLADLVQLAKGGLLDLHVLESSLDDQVAVSAADPLSGQR